MDLPEETSMKIVAECCAYVHCKNKEPLGPLHRIVRVDGVDYHFCPVRYRVIEDDCFERFLEIYRMTREPKQIRPIA